MKIIDLSQTLSQTMPVYPGTPSPQFTQPYTIDKNGFTETKMLLFSHMGTHVDAPAHILKNAKTLDAKAIDHFIGKASVLDMRRLPTATIQLEDIKPFCRQIEESEFLLLYTGWSNQWGNDGYFQKYPVLSSNAAQWLTEFQLKGIGVDMISVDSVDDEKLTIHTILLNNDILIIENLTNLESVLNDRFMFSCLPLKIENADGSPVRAVAIL